MGEITQFPNGLSSFGGVLSPDFPITGDSQVIWADAVNGNDGYDGSSPSSPVKTIARGYSLLRSGHYDTLILIGLGTAYALTAPLVWAKNYTNLIGFTAPIGVSQRARVTNGVTLMTPMVTFSGTGISVKNIQFANFGSHATQAAVAVLLSGQRCYFENCQLAGGGGALAAADASMRSLVISGSGGENLLRHCTIGLDTVLQGNVANAQLEINGDSPRNVFEDCLFVKWGGAASLFVLIGAAGIDRFVNFVRCTFTNFTGGGAASLTNATNISVAAGGMVIMRFCLFIGATAIPANVNIFADPTAASNVILKGLSPT